MSAHSFEMFLSFRHAMITCRLLYRSSFVEIERKVEILINTAERIVKRAIWRAENDDFYKVLTYVDNVKERNSLFRISDETQFSINV